MSKDSEKLNDETMLELTGETDDMYAKGRMKQEKKLKALKNSIRKSLIGIRRLRKRWITEGGYSDEFNTILIKLLNEEL